MTQDENTHYVRLTINNGKGDPIDGYHDFRNTIIGPLVDKHHVSGGIQSLDSGTSQEFLSQTPTATILEELKTIAQSDKLKKIFGQSADFCVLDNIYSIQSYASGERCDQIIAYCSGFQPLAKQFNIDS